MSSRLAAVLLGAAFLVASPAWANTVTWNFDSPTGLLGPSHTYTSNGIAITATGWQFGKPNTSTMLFGKMQGGDENGLGIASDEDHEINTGTFINLDLSNLVSHGIFTGQLLMNSVQPGEGYRICFGSAVGSLGSVNCFNGTLDNTPFTINWTSANHIVGITATSANVLVGSLATQSAVPEPTTITLLGPGAILLGLLRRRLAR